MLLVTHVVLGLLAIAALYITTIALLKKMPSVRFIRAMSGTSALLFILSWLSSGIYYVFYYGGPVKTAIKEGTRPWAHNFLMETKEHIFLFLPFIAIAIFIASWRAGERLVEDPGLRKALFFLTLLGTLIGTFSALAGVVISGSVQ